MEECLKLENVTTSSESFRLPAGDSYDAQLGRNLAVRIYADSRPHNLKVAHLQKGLVLVFNGRELIEEGIGLGVPVAIYSDETYFSVSAEVLITQHREERVIVKRFFMDSVSRKSWKIGAAVNNPFYKLVSSFLTSTYRNHPTSRKIILPLMKLKNSVGIKTRHVKAGSRGEVVMTYSVKRSGLSVKADLTNLDRKSLRRVMLLNEQGSAFFRRFCDSNSSILVGDAIEAWHLVKADQACLSDLNKNLSFCLKKLPNCRLFVGREDVEDYLSWAGLGYELGPQLDFLNYEVEISARA